MSRVWLNALRQADGLRWRKLQRLRRESKAGADAADARQAAVTALEEQVKIKDELQKQLAAKVRAAGLSTIEQAIGTDV